MPTVTISGTATDNLGTVANYSVVATALTSVTINYGVTDALGTNVTGSTTANIAAAPVVSNASFNLTLPATSGEVVGTVTATNSPTSWSITAGNASGFFAIDNSGVITVTAAGASGLTAGTYNLTVQATNSAGSGTGTASATVSSAGAPAGAFGPLTTDFAISWDAIPSASLDDVPTGISTNAPASFTDLACIVRFSTTGNIDARNGGAYAATATVPYTGGNSYHFRLNVRLSNHTYDVFVTPPGQSEILLASNFAFRTEQASVTTLGFLGEVAVTGTAALSNMVVTIPPVVANKTFSLTTTGGSWVAGDLVGTMTGTNTPTSWAITAGNTAGNFAIANNGNITVTSAGITALGGTTGQAVLTAQATNSAGNGSGTATVNYSSASVPAVPVITSATANADATVTVVGTSDPSVTINVSDPGLIGTTTATSGGAWTFTTPVLANGTYTFTATATNANGTSGVSNSKSATVTTGSSDPWATLDGRSAAPVIAAGPPFPTILNGYGGFNARRFDQPTWQPPWHVAGVDYPVGINDSARPLKNVVTAGLPAGAAFSASNEVTISGNNVTLDGYDFSVNGGVNCIVNGSNATIKNCFFQSGPNMQSIAINIFGDGTLIQYCEFNGTGTAFPAGNCIAFENATGPGTAMYNYLHHWNDDTFRLQNQVANIIAPVQWIIKFNCMYSGGYSGVHFDFMQTVVASYNLIDWGFNFQFQPAAVSGVPTEATAFRNSDFGLSGSGTYLGYNSNVHNCTIVGLGTGASLAFSQSIVFSGTGGTSSSLNANPTCHDCYFDFRGNKGPSFDGQIFGAYPNVSNQALYNCWDMTRLSATFNNTGYVTNQQVSSNLSFAQPNRPGAPVLSTAVKNGSAVNITGTAPATSSGGLGGNYVIDVFATDLAWPASLISAGVVTVAPGAGFSLTTSALPAGAHQISCFIIDVNGNAGPFSNTLSVTI